MDVLEKAAHDMMADPAYVLSSSQQNPNPNCATPSDIFRNKVEDLPGDED
jgi:hypothetical protein